MSDPRVQPRQQYFAYGSNLHLAQMATRCPNSWYVGRAILMEYKWQINERGFANILQHSGYAVHGLVYSLGDGDEARLDRSEGVSKGSYAKSYKSVVTYSSPSILKQPTRWIVENGGPKQLLDTVPVSQRNASETRLCIQDNVLVYLSENFVHRGSARDEYIDRMNLGIQDAITLGIPQDFVDDFIRRYIPRRPPARNSHRRHASQGAAAVRTRVPPVSHRTRPLASSRTPSSSNSSLNRRQRGYKSWDEGDGFSPGWQPQCRDRRQSFTTPQRAPAPSPLVTQAFDPTYQRYVPYRYRLD